MESIEPSEYESLSDGRSLSALYDADEEAFVALINTLLWDADEEELSQARGFRAYHTRGLFRRPMPQALKDDGQFAGQIYRSFTHECYSLACRFGLAGLASSISEMFGL